MFNIEEHKANLISITKEIYSDVNIGPILGFKGGTAMYLFHDLSRFSVDLDFDLLDAQKDQVVFQRIEKILLPLGKIKDKYIKGRTVFFLFSYTHGDRLIKIEISKRPTISSYEVKNYLGVPMLIMREEDLSANKLIALVERSKYASRDLYDVWFILKNNWPINETIIQKRTGKNLKEHLAHALEFVKKYPEDKMLFGLGELIDDKTKRWVREHLREDLIFQLQLKGGLK